MIEFLGNIGIQLILAAIYFAVILIPAWITEKIASRYYDEDRRESRLGCPLQALIFCVLAAIMFFIMDAPKRALIGAACKGADDYKACISGDDAAELEYDRR